MQVPVRLLQAAHLSVRPAVLALVASSTAVFTATPFLLRPIADEFDVSIGTAGAISTAQLAGFVLASWAAGRKLRPTRGVFAMIGIIGAVANLAAALAPNLALLATTRVGSGISLGLAAWFAWQDAFGNAEKTGDVAVAGPIVGLVLAPLITILLDRFGLPTVFIALACISIAPAVFLRQIVDDDVTDTRRVRNRATRAATVTLVALGLVTVSSSSVFVFAAAIGTGLNDLPSLTVSLLFSANALAAIPAAKWSGGRGPAGAWFVAIAVVAVVLPSVHIPVVFAASLVAWGFMFFMAIPASFGLLASRSRYPEERAGDAQAVMALGRVFGPLIGGALIGAGRTTEMGLVAGAIMLIAAVLLLAVEQDRFAAAPRPS